MITAEEEKTLYKLLYLENLQKARDDFWYYCKLREPDFYTPDRTHLKRLCTELQAFVAGQIINPETDEPYKILIIELPPRHGKTRTLTNLCSWLIGNDPTYKILTAAYNDDFAMDFSKFTRNIISEEKNVPEQIVFHDIFQEVTIKRGDASAHQWAVDGSFFNFKSAGKGGSITGKGGNGLIIDDPVKDAEGAFNMNQLKKDWLWYTGTWITRKEADAWEIINHTPWAKQDIGGRLQADNRDVYIIKMPACTDGEMLCESILPLEQYEDLKKRMNEIIFEANYNLNRIDVKGLLYGSDWKTYSDFPRDEESKELTSANKMWADTADKGSDYLCCIWGKIYEGYCYVTDVYYTQDSVETTEPEMARRMIENKTVSARYEGNAGGHAIGTHVKDILRTKYNWTGTLIDFFTQTRNKEARILSQSAMVKDKIIMPVDWAIRWPIFHKDVTSFLKDGKNIHDDAPDTLTQIVENVNIKAEHLFIKRR